MPTRSTSAGKRASSKKTQLKTAPTRVSSQEKSALHRIAEAIRSHLKMQETTIERFTARLGLSRAAGYLLAGSMTSEYPRAMALPKAKTLIAIGRELGVSVDWLLGFDAPMFRSQDRPSATLESDLAVDLSRRIRARMACDQRATKLVRGSLPEEGDLTVDARRLIDEIVEVEAARLLDTHYLVGTRRPFLVKPAAVVDKRRTHPWDSGYPEVTLPAFETVRSRSKTKRS